VTQHDLAGLGWSAHFARQIQSDETPARISAVHRDRLEALSPQGLLSLISHEETGRFAVGDWVVCDGSTVARRLEPLTSIGRRAAGEEAKGQIIATNVDTLGIVTSCNADFNPARLERYLAICAAGGALPLIILTKADLATDAEDYRQRAQRLSPLATAVAINACDPEDVARLEPWCRNGQTLALVGSSGVGKTTIQNSLTGIADATQGIREDDAKGRHTTTSRALRPTLAGGWLIDTPGMRELRLTDAADGIDQVFADITELTNACRFSDCRHETEPGCAVLSAIEDGRLDPARFARWQKLQREDQYNTEAVHEAHARYRRFSKMAKAGRERSDFKRRGWEG
jgi:ribosome biogenesis GTPase